jgi:hypothetical protein
MANIKRAFYTFCNNGKKNEKIEQKKKRERNCNKTVPRYDKQEIFCVNIYSPYSSVVSLVRTPSFLLRINEKKNVYIIKK